MIFVVLVEKTPKPVKNNNLCCFKNKQTSPKFNSTTLAKTETPSKRFKTENHHICPDFKMQSSQQMSFTKKAVHVPRETKKTTFREKPSKQKHQKVIFR